MGSTVTIPPGWTVFADGPVSVALPASFKGGRSIRYEVSLVDCGDCVIDLFELFVQGDYDLVFPIEGLLFMSGEPTADGFVPQVGVARAIMAPDGEQVHVESLVRTRARLLLSAMYDYLPEARRAQVDIKSTGRDQAHLIVRAPLTESAESYVVEHWILRSVGRYVYRIVYRTSEESIESLEPVFVTSTGTVIVEKEQ